MRIEFFRKNAHRSKQKSKAVLKIASPSTLESLVTASTIKGREDLALWRHENDEEESQIRL